MRRTATRFSVAALAVVIGTAGTVIGARRSEGGGWTSGVGGGRSEGGKLALQIADYAALPITGSPDGAGNNAGALARVNTLREEPAPSRRLFANDLTGPLYILDRNTRTFTAYLDLNGRGARTGLFDKLATETGLASGFISFEFDPDYARNGRFYTIHLEEIAAPGVLVPDNTSVPGLDVRAYVPTHPIPTPGNVDHEAVVIEWTDSNISNVTFEGTARELLRVGYNSRIHPMGDLTFNPAAHRGDPDWRVLYVSCGDGGSGDQKTTVRLNPQRLDNLVGKILRIVPDLTEHTTTSTVSENGRYRIPRDNPFVSIPGARHEVWAYGLRNPHRLNWDIDPANRSNHHLLAANIGWRAWETVVVIHKGANYGFPFREGTRLLQIDGTTSELPDVDRLPVYVTDVATAATVLPTYPVVQYGHESRGGDAIAGGFVYRGAAVPALRGKYIFGDISTGRVWYADLEDMLAAEKHPGTVAAAHEMSISWHDPTDSPDRGTQIYPTMAGVVTAGYHSRGGKDPDLPGTATVSGSGRVDLRLALDRSGELYVLSKSDGMIRAVTGVVPVAAGRDALLRLIDRPRVPLAPDLQAMPSEPSVVQEHFTFASQAGERVPGVLLKSRAGKPRRPAVILLHGTGGGKNDTQIVKLSEALAARGIIAVAIDARYHGERVRPGARATDYVAAMLQAYRTPGAHPFLYDTVWDVMRLIDYLETRPDIDATRIGVMGISKGGMETYLAAAADPRIAAAVPVIGVQSFRWALDHDSWQSRVGTFQAAVDAAAADGGVKAINAAFVRRFYDRVVPGIYSEFDAPAVLPLIAPRPLLAVNGDSDPRTPLPGVQEAAAAAERAYRAAHAADRFVLHIQPNTGHAFGDPAQQVALDWLVRWLKP
jgi:dienelactone hydrolase